MEEEIDLEVFDVNNTCLWKNDCPRSLHTAINQVLSVKAQDIVRFLARNAIVKGSSQDLSEFADLFGGK